MHAAADSQPRPGLDWRAPEAAGPVRARVRPPGSKSVTNRALVLAALAAGPTVITNPLRARDTLLMAGALRALGSMIEESDGGPQAGAGPGAGAGGGGDGAAEPAWRVTPGRLTGRATVDVGNAGTVLRFVPPVATLARGDAEFHGDERASQRPVGQLLAALRQLGAVVDDGGRGAVPFVVRGRGGLAGGRVVLDASGSSQLVSGLLLSAPCFDQGAQVRHQGPRVPSAPHIAMTVQMLRDAGVQVETAVDGRGHSGGETSVLDFWRVSPGVLRPPAIAVEPDLSNAVPFLAAALVTGGSVTVEGWPQRTLQPAGQILDVLTRMGAACSPSPGGLTVTGTGVIRGITADLRDVSEAVPVLAALAALASSPSAFTGIGHMRTHETDRLAALAAEIGALGGDVTELPGGLEIRPRPLSGDGAVFASHDDHRLVMAAAVLGLAVPGGLRVGNAATVGKTFPGFTTAWSAMLEWPH
jgi:3-phosphoshikimate 1-carboxyvinyltransferase